MRGPCFPCARCPAEISSRLAGLDGQAEEAACAEHRRGRPETWGKTGTAAAPSLPAAARSLARSTLPAAALAVRRAPARGSGRSPSAHAPAATWQSRGRAARVKRGCRVGFSSTVLTLGRPDQEGDPVPPWSVSPRASGAGAGSLPVPLPCRGCQLGSRTAKCAG